MKVIGVVGQGAKNGLGIQKGGRTTLFCRPGMREDNAEIERER